jgi:hypothetical protein
MNTQSKTILMGFIVWLALVFFWHPSVKHDDWARLLVFLAVLVFVPIGFSLLNDLFKKLDWVLKFAPIAAIPLIIAFHLPPSVKTAVLTIPWVLISIIVFFKSVEHLRLKPFVSEMTFTAAQMFLPVGAFSALFDRLGWQPLGFDAAIILLTAIHFHYAGFIFTLLCGLLAHDTPSVTNRLTCWLVIVSVPITAMGITIAQVYHNYIVEAVSAVTVAVAGYLCAFGHMQLAFKNKTSAKVIRLLWLIVSISLFFTMTLAILYAIRPCFPLDFINIPMMRSLHGTANAFGVAGAGVLSWRLFLNKNKNEENIPNRRMAAIAHG